MSPEPVIPDYRGAWTGAIVPALLGVGPAEWLPDCVTGARTVVLCVLDGLGARDLVARAAHLPTMAGMDGSVIHTCVPSTTAAGLTSITTGTAPMEHGVLGYRILVGGSVLTVLSWRTADLHDPEPAPSDVQPHAPFLGEAVPVVNRSEFARSGFTKAHLRGTTFIGAQTTSVMVEHVARLAAGDHPLIYCYDDGIDKVAHAYGLDTGFHDRQLRATDGLVAELLDALDGDTALVVTADHGQVQVGAAGMVPLDPITPLCRVIAGEARFRSLWARTGATDELLAAARDLADGRAWVVTRDEAAEAGWFGAGSRRALSRIGDVIMAPHAPIGFIDPAWPIEANLQTCHGSLTAEEIEVPLLAARGRA